MTTDDTEIPARIDILRTWLDMVVQDREKHSGWFNNDPRYRGDSAFVMEAKKIQDQSLYSAYKKVQNAIDLLYEENGIQKFISHYPQIQKEIPVLVKIRKAYEVHEWTAANFDLRRGVIRAINEFGEDMK